MMKLSKLVAAYKACDHIYAMQLPYREAWQLRQLREQLYSCCQFVAEEEKKLLDEYGVGQLADGGLKISHGREREFLHRLQELHNTEQEWERQPLTLHLPEGATISAGELDDLEGFVSFEELGE